MKWGKIMPKTKWQGIVFGFIMSVTMAYGMEVYNVAIKNGCTLAAWNFSNLTNDVFLDALIEAAYMWVFVFIFSKLWGERLGHALAAKLIRPEKDSPFLITVITSCCTVLVMCPTMSLVAAILFNIILAGQSPVDTIAIWVGTVIKNFPMALLWNLFAAGPVTRALFRLLFKKQLKKAAGAEINAPQHEKV
ncbi:MAG: DUF2798 domain-containing protein [Clostridiales bacterium]|nr:DUF2798 domain-containing protein [Clostridiales bacterium]